MSEIERVTVNREYKDRLLNFIFGSEENRKWTLSLYNAINHSSYEDENEIVFNTIKEVLYLGMHNDTSFLISDMMSVYEAQSTYNPNMPLRQLQYLGHLYESYITANKLNKYGSELFQLPVPKLVVFYNGLKETEDEVILKLTLLKPFLMIHRSEVNEMLLTEYNEAEVMELFKEDGRREGREKERKELMPIIEEKDKQLSEKDKQLSEQDKQLSDMSAIIQKYKDKFGDL